MQWLKAQGKEIVIISGDHSQPTRALAETLGIEHYFAETLPEDKGKLIEQLQDERTNDKVVIAKQSGEISKLTTISRVSAVIYLVAAALISIGFSDFSTNSGKAVFSLGAILVLIAFFAPFLGGSKND